MTEEANGHKMRSPTQQVHVDLGALQERVSQLGSAVQSIVASIDSLRADFGRSRNTNWNAVIGSAVGIGGLLVVGIGLIVAPIYSSLGRVDQALEKLGDRVATVKELDGLKDAMRDSLKDQKLRIDGLEQGAVTKPEFDMFRAKVDERAADNHKSSGDRLDKLDAQVTAIDAALIKRPEIEALLGSLQGRVDAISRNLEDLRHDFGSSYTQGDQIKAMQAQIERLNEAVAALPRKP